MRVLNLLNYDVDSDDGGDAESDGDAGLRLVCERTSGSYDPIPRHPATAYVSFYIAYEFFNRRLFEGRLPDCLITMQRCKGAYGYFSGARFGNTGDPSDIRDEIAMNPQHFAERPLRETLGTLTHEMTHLAQFHFGRPGRRGYHNAQWAAMMEAIGLEPTDTGKPGGKKTGDRVTHIIRDGGPFDEACAVFIQEHSTVLYQDRAYVGDEARRRERKASSKSCFICSGCGNQKAWAKSTARLKCGQCIADLLLVIKDDEDEDDGGRS
jgi:hypothetical protein